MLFLTPSTKSRNLDDKALRDIYNLSSKSYTIFDTNKNIIIHWPIYSKLYHDDESLIELIASLQHLQFQGYDDFTLICPYLPFARSFLKIQTSDVYYMYYKVGNLLTKHGVKKIFILDLHHNDLAPFYKTHFSIECINGFINKWFNREHIINKKICVVGPDIGSKYRCEKFAEYFKTSVVVFNKIRKKNDVIIYSDFDFKINCDSYIIVDDIADTGQTLIETYHYLLKNGVKNIHAFITHMTNNTLNVIKRENIKIITSDSLNNHSESLSILPWIVECIHSIEI